MIHSYAFSDVVIVKTENKLAPTVHLIAGASKGIGRALVEKSGQAGQEIFAISRNEPESPSAYGRWIKGDVAHPESFLEQLPPAVNCLTFCPGKVILGPIKRLTAEQMLETYRTNVLNAFLLIKALLPKLTLTESGSIVFLSSVAASSGLPSHCAISAAKSALEGFAIALAADLAPKVRVNVVAPTLTPTEMGLGMVGGDKMIPMIENRHPLKKLPSSDEIAATIEFLHSQHAASITGQVLKVDAGLSSLRLNDR
jgi:3-oxoacyl-[acyl-carrier protein] reductase